MNEEKNISIMVDRFAEILTKDNIPYEVIFVDDGSKDNSVISIKRSADLYSNIRGLSFSRNFGKEGCYYGWIKCSGW